MEIYIDLLPEEDREELVEHIDDVIANAVTRAGKPARTRSFPKPPIPYLTKD